MSGTEWTTSDLELYHDGELPADRRETLSADLRGDHHLRARLAEIVRVDDLTRQALDGAGVGDMPHGAIDRRPMWRPALAAGLGLLIIGAAVVLLRTRSAPAPVPREAPVASGPAERADEPYVPIRVVLSIPMQTGARPKPPAAPAPTAPPATRVSAPAVVPSGLALADGHNTQSLASAEAFLDALPTERQLQVCRQWVADPHLRRITFLRLEQLRLEPAVADAVRSLLLDLAAQREFEPWLRSHRLVEVATPARSSRGRL